MLISCPSFGITSANKDDKPCADGYLCAAGSTTATGTDTCPIDNFCLAGVQTACNAGTYSTIGGITAQTECIDCPPGKICPSNSVNIQTCPASYYCPIGTIHTDTTPANIVTPCTAGHYCAEGSVVEIKCEPGTY